MGIVEVSAEAGGSEVTVVVDDDVLVVAGSLEEVETDVDEDEIVAVDAEGSAAGLLLTIVLV